MPPLPSRVPPPLPTVQQHQRTRRREKNIRRIVARIPHISTRPLLSLISSHQ
ncbi:hypothetical protein CPAR01_09180 [Colletotrichum paranaense]|uniref:Uncharacterized protein n=6 Tax=Colletotrichum acutatum species complex TaxID=2707335 RepID=A0A9Q8SIN1_9PEZI|nr:uncharacterized protein CLUP02_03473 [Colletotrichum lupini]XP_060319309.1 uncharacterized protein CCOS01_02469 [Colletotrichum costaricense]XP_060347575.1 uncharacterized protein CPAR01_09180 [Colletotrichum paranaense]XP_060387646.1 uncharacterized protein CTAM01_02073 [Colletotrichum tamarilloi]XP_060406073.1 uncharacterized protein CABS01_00176 [Colletotrichum abscissum]KAI3535624.1 hypothetical protein CSPX01_11304 [Colletotrichum filicis]KAK1457018.1 hypothetical protein CMEL01_16029